MDEAIEEFMESDSESESDMRESLMTEGKTTRAASLLDKSSQDNK